MRFSIHDWTGGYRAIKKEVFIKEKEKLKQFTGYVFQVGSLLTAVHDGFKVAEVPFHATDRVLGKSKIPALKTIVQTLSFVIIERSKELIFGPFGKFLVVGGTGFVIQLVIYRLFIVAFASTPLGILNWIAAQPAIFSNYNLNNLWTFKTEKVKSIGEYLVKMAGFFLTSNIGVLIIQSGIIQLLQLLFGRTGLLPYVYFVFATGVLLIYNFTVYRLIIWRKKPSK